MLDSTQAKWDRYSLGAAWGELPIEDRVDALRSLDPEDAQELFFDLSPLDQAELLPALPLAERRLWLRALELDDAADLIQGAADEHRESLLDLLDDRTRREVQALLAYAEDEAGGLMNPRFARLRPDMSVDEAIGYLRKYAREQTQAGMPYYAYVLDSDQRLVGVLSFRELIAAAPDDRIRDVMRTDLVTVDEEMDQEAVARVLAEHRLLSLPVVDSAGRMKGVVTVDDIVDVVEEEATEDIQKLAGMEALDEPYLRIGFFRLVRKRAGWLSILFIGESLTATAMGFFETEIARAVVLALFVPLIISSGGNSGSQASTLVIRAMAVGEVALRDWGRVLRRELNAGLVLGSILGAIGIARILLWQQFGHLYGEHYALVAFAVALAVVGVVAWGTIVGSLLPFVFRRLGFDPAVASAPFVATLVDVTGIVIYFSVARVLLAGTLL